MTENPKASEWAAARGDKWSRNLVGMEATLEPVDQPLLAALELTGPAKIAEVGCGGGGTTLTLQRHAAPGSTVHGFDISATLIELARGRARSEQLPIVFNVADMSKAQPAEPYDRLVSRFGIMFFDDPAAAFASLLHWLEPGGRFAFAAWGPLSENAWMDSGREVVARIVDLPEPDPELPGPFRYADANKLLVLLERAGFADLEVSDWRGPLPIGGQLAPAAAAHFALSTFSSFAESLAKAGDAAFDEARRSLTEYFSRHQSGGVVRLGACVHLFTGARPAR